MTRVIKVRGTGEAMLGGMLGPIDGEAARDAVRELVAA